ncbi:MAG: protease [Bacteroidetes bacterium]|nr:protease [Bacteroidota bacterium]
MKKNVLLVIALLNISVAYSQLSVGGTPKSFRLNNIKSIGTKVNIDKPDLTTVTEEDNSEESLFKLRRFGVIIPMGLDFFEKASMTEVENGKLWILKVGCPEAQALVFYSNKFYLPKGGELYLYNKDKSKVIGAFTSINNHQQKTFATELIEGDEMTLEYFQPNTVKDKAEIEVSELGYAYRDILSNEKAGEFGSSGSCNVNVNCAEGANYRNQQRGVVRIMIKMNSFSMGWCTGSLVNNTSRDLKPYLLTAAHCVENVSSEIYYNQFVFYFNYESASCSNPNYENQITTTKTLTGASKLALETSYASAGSDFLLVLLNDTVPRTYNAYWNGWNINNTTSASGVCIHHPSGDIKKISTFTSPLISVSYTSEQVNANGTHWKAKWVSTPTNYGITEGGSSGSPLFNSNGLIVGTLTGGYSDCSATADMKYDFYGKMSYHWRSNGTTPNKQLKYWLDSLNTGALVFSGDDYTTYVSLKDIYSKENNISTIYPNPTNGDINIYIKDISSDINFDIYDSKGILVLSSIIPSGLSNKTIPTDNIPSGLYIIKYRTNSKSWSQKILLKK